MTTTQTSSPGPAVPALHVIYALAPALDNEQALAVHAGLKPLARLVGAPRVHARSDAGVHALAFPLAGALAPQALKSEVAELGFRLGLDLVALPDGRVPELPGLLVMDMDSTLISIEVIDELAKLAGVGEQVSAITAAAMRGELDFSQSLRQRVGLLRGLSREAIDVVAESLPLSPGAEFLIAAAKARGCKLALVSGGFSYFAERLRARLGLDEVAANQLEIDGGILTGELHGEIVHAERKAELLKEYALRHGVAPAATVAIGDGANDLKMMAAAGLGVAVHAKPKVRAEAPAALNRLGLEGVAYLLGWA